MQEIIIREGVKKDLPEALDLIKELAEYEKAPQEVTNTVEMMEEDGFGDNPVYGLYVAAKNGKIVGISIYYFRYSTWKGKRLYLEDIVVTQSERGKGIGRLLFEKTIEKAKATNCKGMSWQVLDWNTPAIKFYEKYNASFDGEWINCSFSEEQLDAFNQ